MNLDQQLERFTAREDFSDMILGLLSASGSVMQLSSAPRSDGRGIPSNQLSDFLLGLVAVGLTLRATLSCQPSSPDVQAGHGARLAPGAPPRLCGLLR